MKCAVLFGSPRKEGNTASLLAPFVEELKVLGAEVEYIDLYEKQIEPCLGCMVCQDRMHELGCVHEDDFAYVFDVMESSDLIIFATPIYAWYCTAPMKALADRAIYAGNKYYGRERGRSLLDGKGVATVATCGYRPEKGADLWIEGLKRWCNHGKMRYLGALCRRDCGPKVPFMTEEADREARAFARQLCACIQEEA